MEKPGGTRAFRFTPRDRRWWRFARKPLSTVVDWEIQRAASAVRQLRKQFPKASNRELAQHLIDDKKKVAQNLGGALGIFGLFALPADYIAMSFLELSLLCDLAALYQWNVKSEGSRQELLDLLGYVEGVGAITRVGPRLASTLALRFFQKGAFRLMGRAVPMLAVPWGAYLNRTHIQRIGEAALRHFEGFGRAQHKPKQAGGT